MTVQIPSSPSDQIAAMLRLLAGQLDHYRQLKTLSEQQSVCICDGSTEKLLSVLSLRQAVIEQLTKSNTELAPYRDQWNELAVNASVDQREQVRGALDEIERLLQQVVDQDELDKAELKGVQQQVGAQLNHINQAGRAVRAYGPSKPTDGPAVFTDRQG